MCIIPHQHPIFLLVSATTTTPSKVLLHHEKYTWNLPTTVVKRHAFLKLLLGYTAYSILLKIRLIQKKRNSIHTCCYGKLNKLVFGRLGTFTKSVTNYDKYIVEYLHLIPVQL